MSALTILSIFIFIIVLIIFLEYRNEKKYQEKRRQKRQTPRSAKPSTPISKPEPVSPEQKPEPRTVTPKPAPTPEPKPEAVVEVEPELKAEPKPEPNKEIPAETKKLPEADYPPFTHVRLVEMGLSDEEAKEFVAELIPQIETEIPLIEAAIEEGDFHRVEKLTHGIKGSATNLGTGGVSDLLTDYNTYVKTGTDIDIAKAYLAHLVHYTNELKVQYT